MTMRSFFKRLWSTPKCFGLAKRQMMDPAFFLIVIMTLLLSGPATAHLPTISLQVIINANFEGWAAGTVLTAGDGADQPSSIDTNLTATVENSSTLTGTATLTSNFVRLREACGEAPDLSYDNGAALFVPAIAHVAVDVLFENLENYHIYFRNGSGSGIPGPASQSIANIVTTSSGEMHFTSAGGTVSIPYSAGVPMHIDAFFDLDTDIWIAFVNGVRVVNNRAILHSPLGFVAIGFEFTASCPNTVGFNGAMQFDNFLFEKVAAIPVVAPAATLSTVASGLNFPFGVAAYNGDVYIADRNNHVVWKVGPTTPLTRVAGLAPPSPPALPEGGYNGDGLIATDAQLDSPTGVAVDSFGDLYIADSGNHVIRKISSSGMITTVAGTPQKLGLAVNGMPATSATLFGPRGVAVDGAGNLYIADTMNQQIRKVNFGTGNITAVAGVAGETGNNDGPVSSARLNSPLGVAVDLDGNVYIADEGNNKIRMVTGGTTVTTLAGTGTAGFSGDGGPATAAMLNSPSGVAVNGSGAFATLYIADGDNNRIRRVSGGVITTVTAAPPLVLNSPVAVAIDNPVGVLLYIADLINQRVLMVDFTPVVP